MTEPLLEVRRLCKTFYKRNNSSPDLPVRAVHEVSFHLNAGESLGLVGESGCGKSTVARSVLRLTEPDSGDVLFQGASLLSLTPEALRGFRKEMQIIFQDPFASLNPKYKIRDILTEPFAIHGIKDPEIRRKRILELLEQVGLNEQQLDRYPHEFSGGQLQRIGIARAIALEPRLIVADEPVSALDVSIQAQIINLLMDLKDSGIAFLFISHDMGVVERFCDRVAVMYLGRIVETARAGALYAEPRHPYSEALMAAVPRLDDTRAIQTEILGDLPDPAHIPSGCAFHTRCPIKEAQCERSVPELKEVAPGHWVACHLRS
ncbi:MAG: ATP-binding cassette domain-containing protein [Candidatus Nitrohelix vancouverensis]|uniref:ATP-binding cassette domain-containing protein n=1 Tax=Candidatus Nitrohelix vancouverensis TaxID=2705534 RepID=A0A7T0C4T7_9BACT|nr:MAG: ATP-binding cassette domain-containing protein [Candidatus Nitrohelix vancouverensis]